MNSFAARVGWPPFMSFWARLSIAAAARQADTHSQELHGAFRLRLPPARSFREIKETQVINALIINISAYWVVRRGEDGCHGQIAYRLRQGGIVRAKDLERGCRLVVIAQGVRAASIAAREPRGEAGECFNSASSVFGTDTYSFA